MLTSWSLGGVIGRAGVDCPNVTDLLLSAVPLLAFGVPKLKAGAVVVGVPKENGAGFFS